MSVDTKPKRRRRSVIMLAFVGLAATLVANEKLRMSVLDLLFGNEEEFVYTSALAAPGQQPG